MSASAIILAPFDPADLDEILALQHECAPMHRWWSEDQARAELGDSARGHGKNTLVARRGGELVGVAGWVEFAAAAGEFYGAPLVAADIDTARMLIDRLVARARQVGAAWIRIGAWPMDAIKRGALQAAGFEHAFDIVDLALELESAPPRPPDIGPLRALGPDEIDEIDAERFAALYNECFADVPNAPAIDAELARESWESELLWHEGSQVLVDDKGEYRAFLTMRIGGDIEVIGVSESMRRRGLARAMLERAISLAFDHNVRKLSSMCASSNPASLGLHRALGFIEVARVQMWQLALHKKNSPG
jgi:ribosomal protein S18 acetylase RimI-like enzyme